MSTAIGLIGGIASGKSQASQYFRELGIEVIDTDQVARDLVAKRTSLLQKITAHFGGTLLLASGELDRSALRALIFKDQEAKRWLENLLHPVIRETVAERVSHSKSPYCIVAIPLLKRREDYPFLKRILAIETPEDLQIQRLQKRDQIDPDLAKKMVDQQPSNAERRAIADDIIVNYTDLSHLEREIQRFHVQYSQLIRG